MLNRRKFLQLSGIAGMLALLSGCATLPAIGRRVVMLEPETYKGCTASVVEGGDRTAVLSDLDCNGVHPNKIFFVERGFKWEYVE